MFTANTLIEIVSAGIDPICVLEITHDHEEVVDVGDGFVVVKKLTGKKYKKTDWVYTAWEPYVNHKAFETINGKKMSLITTRPAPPGLVSRTPEVKKFYDDLYQFVYSIILKAFPDLKRVKKSMYRKGIIFVWGD